VTVDELANWFRITDSTTKERVKSECGVGGMSDERCLYDLYGNPNLERKFAHQIGIPTEAEKYGRASIKRAEYHKRAYHLAVFAILVSVVSLAMSVLALFLRH
jgi:hypothetical protein